MDAGNDKLTVVERILEQLAIIDKAKDNGELQAAIQEMLQVIGTYTKADRVFLFEKKDGEGQSFDNTFEWCAGGVIPQKDNLQQIEAADMPNWMRIFSGGETILIEDIENIKESMAEEYAMLKMQDIHTEIATPIFYREAFYGFIGLDNPNLELTSLFIQLFRLVGGHLGSTRENLRMLSLLEQEQKTLKTALAEANLNNEIISAISKIYFAIYRINLDKDIYEEVSSDNEVHRLTGRCGRASTRMVELCDNFVAKEYQEKVLEFFDLSTLAERLKEDETIAVEYLAQDGNWHLARFIVKKRAADGHVTNVLYVTRVISDEKRREQYWIVAAEEANKANEAKSEFLSRMSHDIRTPMNAIMGLTDIARHSGDNVQKIQDCLKKIDLAGKNLQQLVNDVLDLTQIESGELKIYPQETDIRELVNTLELTLQSMAAEKEISLQCRLHDVEYPYVLADVTRMGQIYINLLSNAIKYTPAGGSVCFDMSEKKAPDAGTVLLTAEVKDNGIGMDAEFMKVMYSEFARAVDTRVNKVRGSGLGLAIVKQIVDLMGGTIEAESEPGKGTTFLVTLELPYCEEECGRDGQKAEGKQEKEKQEADGREEHVKGMHLLLAEDNDLNYEIEAELLSMHGISCDRAENGQICVEKFNRASAGTYQAILMDMQMPVMNGIEATEKIRALTHPDAKTVPIIATTANAFKEDMERCFAAGMNDHMSKPIDIRKLIEMIEKYQPEMDV